MTLKRTIVSIDSDRENSVQQPACPKLCHFPIHLTHVGTEVFAETVLVAPKTVLKSHSLHGHYIGIRPVRLPNRKLAWPIAEIEKLLNAPKQAATAKEAA